MSSNLLIVATINATEITMAPEALKLRDKLLTQLKNIDSVTDGFLASEATDVLRATKDALKKLEAARKEAKAPALDIGKKIDGVADEFSSPLTEEIERLSRQLAAFQEEERRKAERARREAEELERRRLEQLEEERRKRVAEETAGRTGTLLQDLEIIEDKALKDIVEIRQDTAVATADVQKGVKVLTNYKFEITDPAAVYAKHPKICTVSINLAAAKAQMKNPVFAKKALAGEIPGLVVREEKKASV